MTEQELNQEATDLSCEYDDDLLEDLFAEFDVFVSEREYLQD